MKHMVGFGAPVEEQVCSEQLNEQLLAIRKNSN